MKTYNVTASAEREPKLEVMFAFNGQFGIETTHDFSEASLFSEAVKLNVKVSHMFPGTTDEWNRHIDYCITEELKKEGITYTNDYGTFLK